MIRRYDFPHEVPYRHGSKIIYYHIEFDDFGYLDDDDALYYADSLLNFRFYPSLRSFDAWDFLNKFPMQILDSVQTIGFEIPILKGGETSETLSSSPFC